jgi:hypothetical protein
MRPFLAGDNEIDWNAVFKVFSLERCVQFYEQIGLPKQVIEKPELMIEIARCYLREQMISGEPSNTGGLTSYEHPVERAFAKVTDAYGDLTSNSIFAWCIKYIVDNESVRDLSKWNEALYLLCDSPGSEVNDAQIAVNPEIKTAICQAIDWNEHQSQMSEIRQRLDKIRELPLTEWEDWLDEQDRFAAGIAYAINSVESSIDRIELILDDYYVSQSLERLKSQFSPEYKILSSWVHELDK